MPVHEEFWTRKDGTQIAVGAMSDDHVRNALRLVLRRKREGAERRAAAEALHVPEADLSQCKPDNFQVLASLRAQHGDAVRVEPENIAGLAGANVYVGDRHVGWFGGLSA